MKLKKLAEEFVKKHLGDQASNRNLLTADIYKLLKEVQTNSDYDDSDDFDENCVFVVMSLSGESTDEVYAAIREECQNLGLIVRRGDENPGSGVVIHEIFKRIERAEFIICDLTHERPNVYYELGYAHGIGNEPLDVFLLARHGTVLHFDIAPLRVRYYETIDDLRSIVRTQFAEMVTACRELEGRA